MKIAKDYLLTFLSLEINHAINLKKDFYTCKQHNIKSCGVCLVYAW